MRKCVLKLLTGVAGLTLAASAVSAADLPTREAPPPAPIVAAAPIFTWTGFYGGLNAGWGWRSDDEESVVLTPGPGTPGLAGTLVFPDNEDGGFTGGAQIGYNYQIGSFVVGLETDIQWADTGDDEQVLFTPGPGSSGVFVPGTFENEDADWFGTVRARVGFAFDRVLIYGTGGFAYTDENTGWAVGGGVEWAVPVTLFGSSAVTFGVEGLWLSFEDDDNGDRAIGTFTPAGEGTPVAVSLPADDEDQDFFVARAKLNFKFGTY